MMNMREDVPDPAWKGIGMEDDPLYVSAYGDAGYDDGAEYCGECGARVYPHEEHVGCWV